MLTYRDDSGIVRIEGLTKQNSNDKIGIVVHRLNEYERTGLTPGQIRTLIRRYRALVEAGKEDSPDDTAMGVMELFNSICVSLPRCIKLTDKRRTAIRSLGKQIASMDITWEDFFRRVESSDFLTGRNKKWGKSSFDWILNPSNFMKIIEGNYDNPGEERHGSFDTEDFFEVALRRSYYDMGLSDEEIKMMAREGR